MTKQAPFKYCVVGNIVKTHTDETGTLRYGTAAFPGGTKVYLCGKYWEPSWGTICVIGRSRRKRYQAVDTPATLIENVRCARAYRPAVLRLMNDWEFAKNWWGDTQDDRRDTEAFVRRWAQEHAPSPTPAAPAPDTPTPLEQEEEK
ncbi:MAG: hypothetical protein E7429_06110 [Ruminococcaceae bacterium]|nr:hypothetical protein [Oscillospiraceae bacterium]